MAVNLNTTTSCLLSCLPSCWMMLYLHISNNNMLPFAQQYWMKPTGFWTWVSQTHSMLLLKTYRNLGRRFSSPPLKPGLSKIWPDSAWRTPSMCGSTSRPSSGEIVILQWSVLGSRVSRWPIDIHHITHTLMFSTVLQPPLSRTT